MTLLVLTALFSACQDNTKIKEKIEEETKLDTKDTSNVSLNKACYQFVKNRDTISLNIQQMGKALSGDLSYNFYEKDKSHGKVSGKLIGDTLLMNYMFNAEGTSSIRQVAFLKKGNKLIEGYGDVEERNGSFVFKDIKGLNFNDEGTVLEKTDCK